MPKDIYYHYTYDTTILCFVCIPILSLICLFFYSCFVFLFCFFVCNFLFRFGLKFWAIVESMYKSCRRFFFGIWTCPKLKKFFRIQDVRSATFSKDERIWSWTFSKTLFILSVYLVLKYYCFAMTHPVQIIGWGFIS